MPASIINIPLIPYTSENRIMRGGPIKNPNEAPESPKPLANMSFLSNHDGIPDNTEFSINAIPKREEEILNEVVTS